MKDIIVTVTGTKACKDYNIVEQAINLGLEKLQITPTRIVHGDTVGVEKLSGDYAKNHGINCEKMLPKWKDIKDIPPENIKTGKYGKYNSKAAFERNEKMVAKSNAIIIIDLGTCESQGIIKLANKYNIPVYSYEPEETDHDYGYVF